MRLFITGGLAAFALSAFLCASSILPGAIAQPLNRMTEEGDSKPLLLKDLISEALRANPEIQAARQGLESAKSRISQAGALPDPMLAFRLDNISERLTIGEEDMSMAGVEVSQMVPFPGKRRLMQEMAEAEAEREAALLDAVQRKVAAEVKMLYYELYFTGRARAILGETRRLLLTLADTAQARYSVGEGLQQDVIRAQTELARLLERIAEIEQQEGALQARLNAVLRRAPDAELGEPEPPKAAPLPQDREQLIARATEQAPEIQAANRMVAMKTRALSLARRDYFPDFELSVGYLDRGGLDSMYEAMVSLNLPLYYRSKQQARVAEAAKDLNSMREEQAAAEQQVKARAMQLYLEAATRHRLLGLFSDGILPQARLSFESARAGYSVGQVDFLTLLDNAMKLLEDELEYEEILVRYQKALAGLEELTGLTLTEG
jgi:outer membrane protein TolC